MSRSTTTAWICTVSDSHINRAQNKVEVGKMGRSRSGELCVIDGS